MDYSANIPIHFADIIETVREQKLTELNLSSPPGTKDEDQLHRIPLEVLKFSWLKKLDLTGNNIEYIPESIGNLANLNKLLLGKNNLQELPGSIGKLTKLNTLVLGFNKIKTLPKSIGKLSELTCLFLNSNLKRSQY